jgi:hypothetical protein
MRPRHGVAHAPTGKTGYVCVPGGARAARDDISLMGHSRAFVVTADPT